MGGITVDPISKRAISGQLTGATGTPQSFPDVEATRVLIGALPGNSDTIYIGAGTGSLGPSNGFPLPSGSAPILLEGLKNLSELDLFILIAGDGAGFMCLYDPQSNPLS